MGQKTAQPIYIDTNIYIYFFEDVKPFAIKSKKLFEDIKKSQTAIIGSPLLITELSSKPIRDNNNFLSDIYLNLPSRLEILSLINFDLHTAQLAAKLKGHYAISTPDSIHLATALSGNCSTYITNDDSLAKIKEIKIQILSHV